MPEPPAGFSVVAASRLEPLLARLGATLRDRPLAPLQRETVVVARKKGLRRWVERELAQVLGVAASLDLRSPRDLATDLAGWLVPEGQPDDARQHPFETAALAWRIRAVLDALPADAVYDRVHVYLDRSAQRGEGAMPLAAKLAELFDTYQVYRPGTLAAWAEGRHLHAAWPDEPWQADLWRRLLDTGDAPGLDHASHLTRLLDRLRRADGLDLPVARVSVFGTLVFPPLHWRVLGALARHVPVTVYAVAHGLPAADPYAPTEPANPLLRDLGGRTRDWVSVLTDLGSPPIERVTTASDPACALHRLQAALAADAAPDAPAPCSPSDRSVRVLDCHSPLRELEVLRDEILDAFEALDGLGPADVGVLVPDLGTYAPLIDAVFGAEDVGGTRIPYHVAEHPQAPELRVLDAFHRVLALDAGRATASEVVGLLDVPAVRRRAAVREDELSTLLDWVREARVHWGRDGAHKAAFGMGDDDVHTWRFGIDRLLLGVAVGPTDDCVLGRLPVAEATMDGADLLGRFAEWTEALFGRLATFRRPRPPAEWADTLVAFVDDVFEPRTEAELSALVTLRTALDGLRLLDVEQASIADIRSSLGGTSPERTEPFLTGRVTFADPLALRHAPFRLLAVVGLGDGFPRTEARPDFDLMGADPQPGDPDPHGDDRQTFLDAVMAARDRLVLSYVGRSHLDNTERAASVVLDAFLDTCRRTFGPEATDGLVVRHALQPFSPSYFRHAGDGAAPPHFTYADHHAPPSAPGATDGLRFFDAPALDLDDGGTDDAPEPTETTLDELARAWTNPSRYHCDWLGLSLRLEDAALEDDEPVVLDGLAFHGVKALVLEGLLAGEDEDAIVARLVRSGRLPPGTLGDVYVSRAFGAVADLAARVTAHGPTERVPLTPRGDVWSVSGAVQLGAPGVLRYRPASVKGKDLVRGWIEHVALCADEAAPGARQTVVLGESGASVFRAVPPTRGPRRPPVPRARDAPVPPGAPAALREGVVRAGPRAEGHVARGPRAGRRRRERRLAARPPRPVRRARRQRPAPVRPARRAEGVRRPLRDLLGHGRPGRRALLPPPRSAPHHGRLVRPLGADALGPPPRPPRRRMTGDLFSQPESDVEIGGHPASSRHPEEQRDERSRRQRQEPSPPESTIETSALRSFAGAQDDTEDGGTDPEPFRALDVPVEPGVALVEASAGTGKTYALTELVLRLVLDPATPTLDGPDGLPDLRRLLVVTFTVAATDELKTRIRRALRLALAAFETTSDDPPALVAPFLDRFGATEADRQRSVRRLRRALGQSGEAAVFTIHGFCKRVLERSAFESGEPFAFDFTEDAERLRQRAARDVWHALAAEHPALGRLAVAAGWSLERLLEHESYATRYDQTRVVPEGEPLADALARVEAARDDLRDAWDPDAQLDVVPGEFYSRSERSHGALAADRPGLFRRVATFAAGDDRHLDAVQSATTEKVVDAISYKNRSGPKQAAADAVVDPGFLACDAVAAAVDALERALVHAFVDRVGAGYRALKEGAGMLSFDDLVDRLDHALAPDAPTRAALVRSIQAQYAAALIDEFQDTDPKQYRIFRTAFEGRPLLFIGDPKQAIYAFRGADVFAYLAAKRDARRTYTLGTNYRSAPRLVEAVNHVFGRLGESGRPFVYDGIPFRPVQARADAEPGLRGVAPEAPLVWWSAGDLVDEQARGGQQGAGAQRRAGGRRHRNLPVVERRGPAPRRGDGRMAARRGRRPRRARPQEPAGARPPGRPPPRRRRQRRGQGRRHPRLARDGRAGARAPRRRPPRRPPRGPRRARDRDVGLDRRRPHRPRRRGADRDDRPAPPPRPGRLARARRVPGARRPVPPRGRLRPPPGLPRPRAPPDEPPPRRRVAPRRRARRGPLAR